MRMAAIQTLSDPVPPVGYKYLRAERVLELERFNQHKDIARDKPDSWFPDHQPPSLALFISHRWESSAHPDPSNRQLKAIQALLRAITVIAREMKADARRRAEQIPTLWQHAYLQAAVIVGSARTGEDPVWSRWKALWQQIQELGDAQRSATLLSQIGIWYDYSCMPQPDSAADSLRIQARLDTPFQKALFGLPDLIPFYPIIILRSPGDDYGRRGWCGSEVSLGRDRGRHIVLRIDRIGQRVNRTDLLAPSDWDPATPTQDPWRSGYGAIPTRSELADALDSWANGTETGGQGEKRPRSGWDATRVSDNYWELRELEDRRSTPSFTTPRPPATFAAHRPVLVGEIEFTTMWSRQDEQGHLTSADLATAVRGVMAAADLTCSEDFDLVYTGLLLLEGRRAGSPTMTQFYRQARERWLARRPLLLKRYRHDLTPYDEKVWWLFEDETEAQRPMPSWRRSGSRTDLKGHTFLDWLRGLFKRKP
jgi:hypothetical protein